MTAKELQKRNNKAENLRVLQAETGQFFCESEKGKILYQVTLTDIESVLKRVRVGLAAKWNPVLIIGNDDTSGFEKSLIIPILLDQSGFIMDRKSTVQITGLTVAINMNINSF